MRYVLTILAAATASATAAGAVATSASAVSACGRPGYSYAGVQTVRPAHGVRASVRALGRPHVVSGHVAAWVGVGGPGQGSGGRDAWIQVGLSAFQGTGSRLYFEVNRPGVGPRYTEVLERVPVGSRHRIAVLEVGGRRGWWRVWVDGKPVSAPVHLAGSSGRWRPMAMAETWDGGRRVCNLFAYRFDGVAVAGAAGGGWRGVGRTYRIQDPGYRLLSQRRGTFLARAARPLPRGGERETLVASAQDANGGSGAQVPLEEEDGGVGDADAPVGDGLP